MEYAASVFGGIMGIHTASYGDAVYLYICSQFNDQTFPPVNDACGDQIRASRIDFYDHLGSFDIKGTAVVYCAPIEPGVVGGGGGSIRSSSGH